MGEKAMTIKVLIADDHGVLRAGLRSLLESKPDITVVGEAEAGDEILQSVIDLKPDILLMDMSMPDFNGIEMIRQLQQNVPDTKVLVLTVHEDELLMKRTIQNGALGYIIKRAVESELIYAIHSVYKGNIYIHPSLIRAIVEESSATQQTGREQMNASVLTPREKEVLTLIAQGYTSQQSAEILNVSKRTIDVHRSNLKSKLGLKRRVDLVHYARESGLI
jgi:two-component system response regulator NreC